MIYICRRSIVYLQLMQFLDVKIFFVTVQPV